MEGDPAPMCPWPRPGQGDAPAPAQPGTAPAREGPPSPTQGNLLRVLKASSSARQAETGYWAPQTSGALSPFPPLWVREEE